MNTQVVLSVFITIITLCVVGCTSSTRRVQVNTGQHRQSFEKEITTTVRADYLLYVPEQYLTSQKEWPLILFLHGAGERGSNLSEIERHGLPKLIAKETKEFPFVIVSPQCPKDDWWSSNSQTDTLNALLDHIVSRHRIDKKRIYVTGLSMGGFGTWRLACEYPDRFAAIAPICGKGDTDKVQSIRHLPVWVFHGAKDRTVPLERSQQMVDALKKVDGNVKFTVYPDAGHDSWTATYNNPEIYEWFLKHTRSGDE